MGGSQVFTPAMIKFNKFLNDCEVFTMNASDVPFTWCNGHHDNSVIYERLDWALVNPEWMILFPNSELQNLPILKSNHGPILLTCNDTLRRVPKAFRFEAMWLAHRDFDTVVTQTWNNSYSGNAAQKIQSLTQGNLLLIQEQLAQNPYNLYLLDKDLKLNTDLKILLEQEEVFYAQKDRANWLQLGDKNTKYFHTQALIRRKRNQIIRIRDPNGLWVEGDVLHHTFIKAFKLRFTAKQAPNPLLMADFLHMIEPYVTSQDNVNLLAPVTNFELERAVKGIGPLKALGPDGLQDVNHTNIALIPKVDSPKTINHYRPISLCNKGSQGAMAIKLDLEKA
ncbi:unnamed protein product [Prunus armeniaca]